VRSLQWWLTSAFVLAACSAGFAQSAAPAYTPLELAVGCAPPPTLDPPNVKFRVIGIQDVVPRIAYGSHDLLVVDGGTNAGVQVGQQFYVRRANRFGAVDPKIRHGSRTVAWIHIVAVNESTAIAAFDHICGVVVQSDYLEPFVAPVVPAGADRDETPGQPDFSNLGQVLAGDEGRSTMGAGDFVLIDRGRDQGVEPGARFALYRDVKTTGMPLASLGEAVVISTSQTMSLTRITRARDAIVKGDYVAARK
jgi:hypothetical protein